MLITPVLLTGIEAIGGGGRAVGGDRQMSPAAVELRQ